MSRMLSKLHARFVELDEQFRERPLRERMILGCGFAMVAFFAVDLTLIHPATTRLDRVGEQRLAAEADITRLEGQLAALHTVELTPEEQALLARKRRAEEALADVNRRIEAEISGLVPPEAMLSVLEEMLAADRGLTLVRVTSEPPHRVGAEPREDPDAQVLDTTNPLYRHGLRIDIEGDFASTLEYLERVEDSPWHLFWDRLDYRVERYPTARITIELHTVSEQQEWIGV